MKYSILNRINENVLKVLITLRTSKKKGAIGIIEMLVICAALLLIVYPFFKTIIDNTFNTITAWFTTELPKIFS